ncbi:hypothetical protein ISCGN_004086 [Ixodes scapularis]
MVLQVRRTNSKRHVALHALERAASWGWSTKLKPPVVQTEPSSVPECQCPKPIGLDHLIPVLHPSFLVIHTSTRSGGLCNSGAKRLVPLQYGAPGAADKFQTACCTTRSGEGCLVGLEHEVEATCCSDGAFLGA